VPFLETAASRIHYREDGAGTPLLIINGGGLNSAINFTRAPFDTAEEFKGRFRCIRMDLRHSLDGETTGELEVERAWDAYIDDYVALLDHLGVDRFLVIGFCIGNPLAWNLVKRCPERVIAIVAAQPSAVDPRNPTCFLDRNLAKWAPRFAERHPGLPRERIDAFVAGLYKDRDFVITVGRDFVRDCCIPLLVMPDDTESHPFDQAMEMARLSRKAQVSMFPWKDSRQNIDMVLRHLAMFLAVHDPAGQSIPDELEAGR